MRARERERAREKESDLLLMAGTSPEGPKLGRQTCSSNHVATIFSHPTHPELLCPINSDQSLCRVSRFPMFPVTRSSVCILNTFSHPTHPDFDPVCSGQPICRISEFPVFSFTIFSICIHSQYIQYISSHPKHPDLGPVSSNYTCIGCLFFPCIPFPNFPMHMYSQYMLILETPRVGERWGAGVETQKNVRGEIGGWGRVPFNKPYAPSLSAIYDGA